MQPLLNECWFITVNEQQRLQQLFNLHVKFGRTEREAVSWMAQTDKPNARLIAKTAYLAQRKVDQEFVSSEQWLANKGLSPHDESKETTD